MGFIVHGFESLRRLEPIPFFGARAWLWYTTTELRSMKKCYTWWATSSVLVMLLAAPFISHAQSDDFISPEPEPCDEKAFKDLKQGIYDRIYNEEIAEFFEKNKKGEWHVKDALQIPVDTENEPDGAYDFLKVLWAKQSTVWGATCESLEYSIQKYITHLEAMDPSGPNSKGGGGGLGFLFGDRDRYFPSPYDSQEIAQDSNNKGTGNPGFGIKKQKDELDRVFGNPPSGLSPEQEKQWYEDKVKKAVENFEALRTKLVAVEQDILKKWQKILQEERQKRYLEEAEKALKEKRKSIDTFLQQDLALLQQFWDYIFFLMNKGILKEKIDAQKKGDKDREAAALLMDEWWRDLRDQIVDARRFAEAGDMSGEWVPLRKAMVVFKKLCAETYVLPDGTTFERSGKFSKQLNDLLDGENNPCEQWWARLLYKTDQLRKLPEEYKELKEKLKELNGGSGAQNKAGEKEVGMVPQAPRTPYARVAMGDKVRINVKVVLRPSGRVVRLP